MRKRKHKHKHKEERYYLSEKRAFNARVRYNRRIYSLIMAFRRKAYELAGLGNPF